MNLAEMIALVRKDLHDEDSGNYRWTDAELTRHISRAVRELSESLPLPAMATLPTTRTQGSLISPVSPTVSWSKP